MRSFTPLSLRQPPVYSLHTLCILFCLLSCFGCQQDDNDDGRSGETPAGEDGPMTCVASPACAEMQRQVDSCDEGDETCHVVSLCGAQIFCEDEEFLCDAVPACTPDSVQLDSCEGAGPDCYEVSECGATIYCEPVPVTCLMAPVCAPDTVQVESCEGIEDRCVEVTECDTTIFCEDQLECDTVFECTPDSVQVDSCEGAERECYEVSDCDRTIYCEAVEVTCDALPQCQEDEVESTEPCMDNGETCRSETLCDTTIYCRPAEDVALLACEDESGPATLVTDARVEGDKLHFGVSYSGGCALHAFPGCFSEFQESAPVQVSVTISHQTEGDPCDAIISEERSLDLSFLKSAYQDAYGTESGSIILNIVEYETPLTYSF